MFKENVQGSFSRPSLYKKLDYSLLDNSVGTGYGLLISIKNTMTSTMSWWLAVFYNRKVIKSRYFTTVPRNRHDYLGTKPVPHTHPPKPPLMLLFMGIYSYLKLHGKERSRKRDWRSHLGIDLGASSIADRAKTNWTNTCSSKTNENAK